MHRTTVNISRHELVLRTLSTEVLFYWCNWNRSIQVCSKTPREHLDFIFVNSIDIFYMPTSGIWHACVTVNSGLRAGWHVQLMLEKQTETRFPRKHQALAHCRVNVDLPSTTLAQHSPNIFVVIDTKPTLNFRLWYKPTSHQRWPKVF